MGKNTKGQKTALCCPEDTVYLSIKLLKMSLKDEVSMEVHFMSQNGLSRMWNVKAVKPLASPCIVSGKKSGNELPIMCSGSQSTVSSHGREALLGEADSSPHVHFTVSPLRSLSMASLRYEQMSKESVQRRAHNSLMTDVSKAVKNKLNVIFWVFSQTNQDFLWVMYHSEELQLCSIKVFSR